MAQNRGHWPALGLLCRGDWSRVTDFFEARVIIISLFRLLFRANNAQHCINNEFVYRKYLR